MQVSNQCSANKCPLFYLVAKIGNLCFYRAAKTLQFAQKKVCFFPQQKLWNLRKQKGSVFLPGSSKFFWNLGKQMSGFHRAAKILELAQTEACFFTAQQYFLEFAFLPRSKKMQLAHTKLCFFTAQSLRFSNQQTEMWT